MIKETIKVLHIGLSSNIGGIETVVYNWFCNIDQEKVQFDFINVEDKPLAFEEEFRKAGCKIYRISSRKNNPIESNQQLQEIMRKTHYDFVHHHVMGITWPEPTLIAAKIPGTVPIIHNHVVFRKNNGLLRVFLNALGHIRLHKCNYLKIACGYDAGNSVFPKGSFKIINNGINYEEKEYNDEFRKEIREKYKIADDCILIGHVGRASYQKNYPYILDTIAELSRRNENFKCLLVGDIDKNKSITDKIDSLGLNNTIILAGKVRNIEKYYSAFDIFFFPSNYEGVSVSLIEAQCSGLPCVISKNIAKETEISNLIEYIDIANVEDGVKTLSNTKLHTDDEREHVILNPEFDIKATVRTLLNFYYENIKRVNDV